MIRYKQQCYVIAAGIRCSRYSLLIDRKGRPTCRRHGGRPRGSKAVLQMLQSERWQALQVPDKVRFLDNPLRFPWLRVTWRRLSEPDQRQFRKLAREELPRELGRSNAHLIPFRQTAYG